MVPMTIEFPSIVDFIAVMQSVFAMDLPFFGGSFDIGKLLFFTSIFGIASNFARRLMYDDFSSSSTSSSKSNPVVVEKERKFHYETKVKQRYRTEVITSCVWCGTVLGKHRNCRKCGGYSPDSKEVPYTEVEHFKVYD